MLVRVPQTRFLYGLSSLAFSLYKQINEYNNNNNDKEEFKIVLHGSKRVLIKQLNHFILFSPSYANGQQKNLAKIFLTLQSNGIIIMILKTILKLPTKLQSPVPRKHQNNNKFMHAYGSTPRLEKKIKIKQKSEQREREREK